MIIVPVTFNPFLTLQCEVLGLACLSFLLIHQMRILSSFQSLEVFGFKQLQLMRNTKSISLTLRNLISKFCSYQDYLAVHESDNSILTISSCTSIFLHSSLFFSFELVLCCDLIIWQIDWISTQRSALYCLFLVDLCCIL